MSATVPGLAIRRDRQLHRDHRTAADAGGEHDLATERDGDRARDAEADPDARAANRGPEERIEGVLRLLGRELVAVVGDLDDHAVLALLDGDDDAIRPVRDRVVEAR